MRILLRSAYFYSLPEMRLFAVFPLLCLALSSTGSQGRRPGDDGWGPPSARAFAASAYAAKAAGRIAEARTLFQNGFDWCARAGFPKVALRYQIAAASSQLLAGHFKEAAAEFLRAEQNAQTLQDIESLAAIRGNLASLYAHFHEFEAATHVAEAALSDLGSQKSYTRPYLVLLLATFYAGAGQNGRALPLFEEALNLAAAYDTGLEIQAWDALGSFRLKAGDLRGAEHAFLQSFRTRLLVTRKDIPTSYAQLGEVYQAEGRTAEALRFSSLALENGPSAEIPAYLIWHLRGRARATARDLEGAFSDFGNALRFASAWRAEKLPADVLRTSSNVAVQEIYDSYLDTAARLYDRTGRAEYARASWEAEEGIRAASLRETLGSAWRDRINPEYWNKLAMLREKLLRRTGATAAQVLNDRELAPLQTELLQMETRAGLSTTRVESAEIRTGTTVFPKISESIPPTVSLPFVQRKLDRSQALISFRFSEYGSYRWVVTQDSLALDRVPDAGAVFRVAADFQRAVQVGDLKAEDYGSELYRMLFGNLPRTVVGADSWLLALDGRLFNIPLSALVAGRTNGRPVFLTEEHTLAIVPGAWAAGPVKAGGDRFAAIADPIYNDADSRAAQERRGIGSFWSLMAATRGNQELEIARLPGSRREVESCVREFSGLPSLVLLGPDASNAGLRRILEFKPDVLHLSAHVVPVPGDSAMVLLTRIRDGAYDSLAPRDITALHVPGSLVVMSGCASGKGTVLPGAGLLGLSRAWLAAGAIGVIGSHWPVPDDTGVFFRSFYRHLRTPGTPEEHRPAEALRRARIEMLRGGGPAARPSYWSAYEFFGWSN